MKIHISQLEYVYQFDRSLLIWNDLQDKLFSKRGKVQEFYLWYATLHIRKKGIQKTFMYLPICAKEIELA